MKKNQKQTSASVARLAAKWAGMTDAELSHQIFPWTKFCRDLRSICASALVQTKPKAVKKVTKKKETRK